MKKTVLVLHLFISCYSAMAQPTGGTGIYLELYEVRGKDTVYINTGMDGGSSDRMKKVKMGAYTLRDAGKKQYGFSWFEGDRFIQKTVFWNEENKIEITGPAGKKMKIDFVGLPVGDYFLSVHFQKGHFAFSLPVKYKNQTLEALLPRKYQGQRSYGYDISPEDWGKHRINGFLPESDRSKSILPDQPPVIPYAAGWSAMVTRSKSLLLPADLYQGAERWRVLCQFNNGQVYFSQTDSSMQHCIIWYGKVKSINKSEWEIAFHGGYRFGYREMIPDPGMLVTDEVSIAAVKGMYLVNAGDVNGQVYVIEKIRKNGDTVYAKPTRLPSYAKLRAMAELKDEEMVRTLLVNWNPGKETLYFFYDKWDDKNPGPVLHFRVKEDGLELIQAKRTGQLVAEHFFLQRH